MRKKGEVFTGCGCSAGTPAADTLSSKWSLLFLLQQDIDTAIVSDTTDDLWFLNESPSDQTSAAVKVETADCEEVKEDDKKVPFQTATVHVFHWLASFKRLHAKKNPFYHENALLFVCLLVLHRLERS